MAPSLGAVDVAAVAVRISLKRRKITNERKGEKSCTMTGRKGGTVDRYVMSGGNEA